MSYNNPRLDLTDNGISMIMKMSGGNPGAVTVLMSIFERAEQIDPDAAFGPIGQILALDTLDIYEDRIWMFFKDLCKQNLTDMIAMMRAQQLGFLPSAELTKAIDNYGSMSQETVQAYIAQVRERLPNFSKT